MKQSSENSRVIKALAIASGIVSSTMFTTSYARHEDSAGVYKAQVYRERISKAVEELIASSNIVPESKVVAIQTGGPTLQKSQVGALPNSVALAAPAPVSMTDKLVSKFKSFFSSPEDKQKSQAAQPAAVNRSPSSASGAVAPIAQSPGLQANAQQAANHEYVKNLPVNKAGVETYQITSQNVDAKIPYLAINKETKITTQNYALADNFQKHFASYAIAPLITPENLAAKSLQEMIKIAPASIDAQFTKLMQLLPTAVSHSDVEKVKWMSQIENDLKLVKYVPLTAEETRLLNGILLYRQGDRCAVAVSLFYPLTKTPFYESEGNYYLSMCSKQLGLMTDFYEKARRVFDAEDLHYSKKLFKELSQDVPPEVIDGLGKSLFKLSSNKKAFEDVDPIVKGNVYYILANFGAKTERFRTTLSFSQLVPEKHPKFLEAQFLQALAEYEIGDKLKAMQIQEKLIKQLALDKKNEEFQALVALNLARMQFQEKKFKDARENFVKVSKDHPLWVQSLTEMGWAQLEMADYGGAIGNMYSVQSPFFNAVYKPESYVIRTIGYLNLCLHLKQQLMFLCPHGSYCQCLYCYHLYCQCLQYYYAHYPHFQKGFLQDYSNHIRMGFVSL